MDCVSFIDHVGYSLTKQPKALKLDRNAARNLQSRAAVNQPVAKARSSSDSTSVVPQAPHSTAVNAEAHAIHCDGWSLRSRLRTCIKFYESYQEMDHLSFVGYADFKF